MSLNAWRTLSPPGKLDPHAAAACSSDPDASAALVRSVAERKAGTVICGYLSRYGRFILPQSFAMDGGYRITHLRYAFQSGRLTAIEFHASIDAYSSIISWLTKIYGPADKLVRDRVNTELGRTPRVTQRWIEPGGSIELMDPVPPYTELRVRFGSAPAGLGERRSS